MSESYISKRDIESIIIDSKVERQNIVNAINSVFPNIKDSIYIEKFEELLNSSKEFVYDENFHSTLGGSCLIKSLVLNASQQFCFWVDSKNQNVRTLRSSDFEDCEWSSIFKIISPSMTMRKERKDILDKLWDIEEEYGLDNITKSLDSEIFQRDFFRKKKNLLIMFLVRFKDLLELEVTTDLINSINPAIDYQIPKMLRAFDIIEYPIELESKIRAGKIIAKDSTDELFIRSITYMALIMIQEKYGFNQVKLDWWLWSNRHNEIVQKFKHHCTLTEDY